MKQRQGSIYRSKDGKRWFARLRFTDLNGRSRERKRTCRTYAEAKRVLIELQNERANETAEVKTFRFLDRYYRENYIHAARFVGGQKLSGFRQSLASVEHYMNAALEVFGDADITTITYADLERFKASVASRPTQHGKARSVSDTNHYLKRLRRLFNVAIENGWLNVNPFTRGRPLIIETFETQRTRILSAQEETRLLAQCTKWRKHLRAVIIFAVETGCRRGEIMALKWNDVDLAGRVIRIEARSTKTLRGRLVPISSRLGDTLAAMRQSYAGPWSYVFGKADFKTAFNRAAQLAGLSDVRFHDLRHTAITRMLEKGISPPLVMRIAGHSQQRTFMRYVNQSETSVADIARLLDRAA